jgi:hypothetical protein
MGHDSILYLDPIQFQESIPPFIARQKYRLWSPFPDLNPHWFRSSMENRRYKFLHVPYRTRIIIIIPVFNANLQS